MRCRGRAAEGGLAASSGLAIVLTALLVSCGDRSALTLVESFDAAPLEAGAGSGPPDAEAEVPRDARPDAARDSDATAVGCPGGDVPIYMLNRTPENRLELYSFAPRTSAFAAIDKLSCVVGSDPVLASIAVDRAGIVYVYDQIHGLYQVDTTTAKCGLPFGFQAILGLAFVQRGGGPGETFCAVEEPGSVRTSHLGTIDQTLWTFIPHAPIAWGSMTVPYQVELAGTLGGDLFALFLYKKTGEDLPQRLAQIDRTTGQILSSLDVRAAFPASFDFGGFAAWGSDFYFFDSHGSVTRYTRATGATAVVATLPGANFIAAAASSCALQ